MTLTITLRGKQYTADNPTDNEILSLVGLFLPGDSERDRIEALQDAIDNPSVTFASLFGFDLEDTTQSRKATAVILVRMMNPIVKAQVSHTLSAMFPMLQADGLVTYRLLRTEDNKPYEDFRLKLSNEEILGIIREVLQWMAPKPETQEPAKRSKAKRVSV
jgi:hypothetical protein